MPSIADHMIALSLLAVGRLPEGQSAPETKDRKSLQEIAFKVGDALR